MRSRMDQATFENMLVGIAEAKRKPCAICRIAFTPYENAQTTETRQLCLACRKQVKRYAK